MKDIQWYPGHMAKANRIITETRRYIDVVVDNEVKPDEKKPYLLYINIKIQWVLQRGVLYYGSRRSIIGSYYSCYYCFGEATAISAAVDGYLGIFYSANSPDSW